MVILAIGCRRGTLFVYIFISSIINILRANEIRKFHENIPWNPWNRWNHMMLGICHLSWLVTPPLERDVSNTSHWDHGPWGNGEGRGVYI
jgi:hypothetical protein